MVALKWLLFFKKKQSIEIKHNNFSQISLKHKLLFYGSLQLSYYLSNCRMYFSLQPSRALRHTSMLNISSQRMKPDDAVQL